jgi:rare lipoprotein A
MTLAARLRRKRVHLPAPPPPRPPDRRCHARISGVATIALVLFLSACASTGARPSTTSRTPKAKPQVGEASWYGPGFHGRRTASGEIFDMHAISAAHRTLPLGTVIEVRNLENGRTLVARVNDRGPWVHGRIVDLSMAAAEELGLYRSGVARVRVTVVGGPLEPATGYWIQVGAFREEKRARALQAELERRYPGTTVRAESSWWRVQVPSGEKKGAAAKLERSLRRAGYDTALVTAAGGG